MAYQLTDEYGRTIEGNYYDPAAKTWNKIPTGTAGSDLVNAPATQALTNDYVDQSGTVHNAAGGTTKATSPTTGSSGPGPDSILVTPNHTYVTSGNPNTQTKVTNKGTASPGGYSEVYGPAPVDTQTASATTNKNPNVTTNEQDAAAAAQRNGVQQPQQTQQQTQAAPMGSGFAPGQTGAEVKVLQDMLVSKGFMTAAQVATGPGVFGPKTQAALAAYQAQNGAAPAPTSSPAASTATYKNEPATPTKPAKSAVQKVIDDYTAAYTALGLGDIKAQYEKFVKEETDLATEKAGKIADINDNPWLSEGVRLKTIDRLNERYLTRENILTNKVSLLDSLYKQGQAEVNNIVTKAEAIDAAQAKEASDLAQKRQDAIDALALAKAKESPSDKYGTGSIGEYNFAKSQGYTGTFTQYQNEDANRKAKAAGSGAAVPKTLEERNQATLGSIGSTLFGPRASADSSAGSYTVPGTSGVPYLDSSGYATPEGWKAAIGSAGVGRDTFISQFGDKVRTTTAKDGTVTVPSAYGLTPKEQKLITG